MPTHWASKDLENIVFDNIRYYLANGQKRHALVGRRAGRREAHLRAARHSGAGAKVPRRRRSPVRLRGRLFQHQEGRRRPGRHLLRPHRGLRDHPEIFRKWFGKVIPTGDNKFSALNSAVFSGGSFIYVPPGVKVKHPLQAYFRINAENFGQFERTLIIADEGSEVMYMEGCTAPKFETATLH
jgi:Fe-S cluster assembly protein SufB